MQNRFLFLEEAQHPPRPAPSGEWDTHPHIPLSSRAPSSLHTPPTLIGASILAPTALELGLLLHLLILEPHCLVPDTSASVV